MKKVNETGHAKNVANFETLISFCEGYGASYKPGNAALEVGQLKTLHATAGALLGEVKTSRNLAKNAVNSRAIIFTPLRTLSTRLLNAISACDVSDKTIADAAGLNRKIQGTRASEKEAPEPAPGQPEPSEKSISASQRSIDQQIEHFSEFIDLLEKQPAYRPNEDDLNTAACTTLLEQMKAANTEAKKALTRLSNSRIARDEALYNPGTGLVSIAQAVKRYVKSVFDASSPQAAQVAKIEFKNLKRNR